MMDRNGDIVIYIGQPWSTGGKLVGEDENGLIIRQQDDSEDHVSSKGFAVCHMIDYGQYTKNKESLLAAIAKSKE